MADQGRRGKPPSRGLIRQLQTRREKGMSIKQACREVGLGSATYYAWKKLAEAGENGNYQEFYERVVLKRKQRPLQTPAASGVDWRSIEHFKAWVAGEAENSKALILDSGEPWEPEQWQLDPVEDLLSDEFQAVWLIVPEGNGKTTLTAAIVLYLLEHQLTPEIPIGSATTTQAETLFRQIEGFVIRSGKLLGFNLAPGVRRIDCRTTMGHTRVYPHNERSGDGVIPSASVLDEGHLHPDLRLYRTWKGKYRKRRGPVMGISTAGEPGSEFEDLRSKILKEGEITRDEGEYIRAVHQSTVLHDWAVRNRGQADDMEVVERANPLSIIRAPELAEKRAEPEMTPEHWLRRTCNIPTRVEGAAIQPEQYDALVEDDLALPKDCWRVAWVDFGWEIDTTAMGLLFWESHERRVIGDVRIFEPPVDEEDVVAAMVEIQDTHDPVGWVFDPAASGQMMAQQLDKGQHPLQGDTRFTMLKHKNDPVPMAQAAARLDEAIRTKKLVLPENEKLRRHFLNAVKKRTTGEKWRYDRPQDAKGEKRKRFPTDALIGVAMGHNHAVTEHETDKEPIAIWA